MLGNRRAFFFGITVSEIAFILFFAILLFAFFRFDEDDDALAQKDLDIEECRKQLVLIGDLLEKIRVALDDPDIEQEEIIRKMVEVDRLTAELVELEVLVEKLKREIEVFDYIKKEIDKGNDGGILSESDQLERMRRALALLEKLELWIKFIAPPSAFDLPEEAQAFALKAAEDKLADSVTSDDQRVDPNETIEDVREQLAAKEGQLQFCMTKLNECRGGRDLPPCWVNANDSSKIDFLLKIDLFDDGLQVRPGDEPSRRDAFHRVPGTADLLGDRVNISEFAKLATVVFNHSDQMKCRHYVLITDRSEYSYKSTLTIERYFYKVVGNVE